MASSPATGLLFILSVNGQKPVLTHRHPGREGLLIRWFSFVMDPATVPKTILLHILTCCRHVLAMKTASWSHVHEVGFKAVIPEHAAWSRAPNI